MKITGPARDLARAASAAAEVSNGRQYFGTSITDSKFLELFEDGGLDVPLEHLQPARRDMEAGP
jgi:hypothetical protein